MLFFADIKDHEKNMHDQTCMKKTMQKPVCNICGTAAKRVPSKTKSRINLPTQGYVNSGVISFLWGAAHYIYIYIYIDFLDLPF